MMDTLLYDLVLQRNAQETYPFEAIHDSNTTLLKETDTWQRKCERLEQQVIEQRESLERVAATAKSGNICDKSIDETTDNNVGKSDMNIVELHYAESAALKNERKMREELERLQGQVKIQDERYRREAQELEDANLDRMELKALCLIHERDLSKLKDENERQLRALEHLTTQVSDSEQRADLAEKQCTALKDAIRMLQEDNDGLKKENRQLETRMIEEKNRLSSEVNSLNEMIEQLRKEAGALHSLKKQEEKRKSWFGFASSGIDGTTAKATSIDTKRNATIRSSEAIRLQKASANFGKDLNKVCNADSVAISVTVPSQPNHIIQAHRQEAACVR